MDKNTFIETLLAERTQWEELLEQVEERHMLEPGAAGTWSVKDVIAHIMWSEQEIIGVCKTHTMVGSELWKLSQDERNAVVFAQQLHRSLQDILLTEVLVYAELLKALQQLSDEDFNNPRNFAYMPESWIPWQIFASGSYEHYHEHMPSIRAWLQQVV